MLFLISPAKSLNLKAQDAPIPPTRFDFRADVAELSKVTRGLSRADLRRLMEISEKLAELNYERFQAFDLDAEDQGLPAAYTFNGDVYGGLRARDFTADQMGFAQDHLRILSGFYGLLRPLDQIQPYRLEMGIRLKTPRGHSLYEFWGDRIARALDTALRAHQDQTVINLASIEYASAVDQNTLKAKFLNIRFEEEKAGLRKVISFHAKRARGLMARYAIENQIDRAEGLKSFDVDGYGFDPIKSTDIEWVFVRPHAP